MIEIKDLKKSFGTKEILKNISFSVNEGSIYGIVGTNGAGKSTILRLASGIYYPNSGNIFVDGENIFDNPEAKSKIVFVSDDVYYPIGSSVSDMERIYKTFYPNFSSEEFYKICESLKFKKTDKIGSFSKGMKRQIAVALALACNTKYVFFDETFDGLDPVMRNLVKRMIYSKVSSGRVTVLLTSHYLREIEDICDCICILHDGKVVLSGDVNDIKTNIIKIQISYNDENHSFEQYPELEILDKRKFGSVFTLIIRGSEEKAREVLGRNAPVIFDVLPLTLEEIFVYEMEVYGYVPHEIDI